MNTVSSILKTIGRAELSRRLGVGSTTISAAAVAGKFPSAWYPTVKGMCEEHGLNVTDDMFNFRQDKQQDQGSQERGA